MTKIVVSTICHNELPRFLPSFVESCLEWADEIAVLDDGSDDGTYEFLMDHPGVVVMHTERSLFFEHEGQARNALLQHTFEQNPTHVVALDCDEFIADGAVIRAECEKGRLQVASLTLQEVWYADRAGLQIRQDGGWKQKSVPFVFTVPARRNPYQWRCQDKASACPREPKAISAMRNRARAPITDLLHFGWANVADRKERFDRYATRDGFGHAPVHIASIMLPDDKITLSPRSWPVGLEAFVDDVADRAQQGVSGYAPNTATRPPEVIRNPASEMGGIHIAATNLLPSSDAPAPGGPPPTASVPDDFAIFRRNHADGRWVGLRWDGTVESGTV